MPIIPLPTRSTPLANVPSPVLDTQRRPTVDNRGLMQASQQLADAQKQPEVPMSLAEPYAALGSVGNALAKAGSVLGALGLKRQEAEADVQIAQGDAAMDGVLAEHEKWKVETNATPADWDVDIATRIGSLKQQLADRTDLRPAAREQIRLRLTRFEGQSKANVMASAAKATFAEAKSAFTATIDSATESQDGARFEEALNAGAQKGYFHPHEIEAAKQQFAHTGERQKKEAEATRERQEYELHAADAIGDPKSWLESNATPWKGKELLWQRTKNIADAREREGTAAVLDDVQNGIATGQLAVPKDIEAIDSPFLTPKLREEAKRYLSQRDAFAERQDKEVNGVRNAIELRKAVAGYDPASDPTREKYFNLVKSIGSRVEQSMAGEISGELYRKYGTEAPNLKMRPEIERNVSKSLDVLFDPETGSIPWKKKTPLLDSDGKQVKDENGNVKMKPVEDPAARQRAIDAQTVIETKMADFYRSNPAATLPEVKKRLQEVLPEGTRAGALDLMQKKLAPKVSAVGKVTSYGYAGDSTPDRNSSAGIGAFVPNDEADKIKRGESSDYRLREGDLAVSPDIEKQFRAAGVKPGGAVLVQLANGETRRVRWMDRTAQDEQVENGKIKGVSQPLRGRFDFYSTRGRHPYDGQQILSWSKPSEVASR